MRESSVRLDILKRNAALNGVTLEAVLQLIVEQSVAIRAHGTILINTLETIQIMVDRIIALETQLEMKGATIQ